MREDCNNISLKNGDIIDLHQTVNGQNLFVVLNIASLDIRYFDNLDRKYEYDKESLLSTHPYSFGEVEWEIVGNIHKEDI